MVTRPRILLADDHALVLEGLAKLVTEDCDLVGKVEDGRALIQAAQKLEPDVIVLDISMPKLNGLDAARQLKKLLPSIKLIFLTMHADPLYAKEAFQIGASGFLLKRSAASELMQAINAVMKGQYYVTPAIAKDFLSTFTQEMPAPQDEASSLTPRQREVLQLIAEGYSTKEMATILHVSPKTIEFHRAKIFRELNCQSTAELTRYAITHGLVSPE
ncbi:response regulator transcription factor [Candidatus Nitrospira allomarina]|uniref:Response regulator transcription factor n=1 Tax=Candidatus Nitrospira allomarina TaxID=3020900 RepID=A0AA96GDX5_9BACT|nr:response regulator transcription factor [Candidatus Nitrospira allomarina]WNM60038.1 response regulator transcription factor [Candidatus Nitrospira allomarina]